MTPEEITKLAEEYANETVSMRHTTAIVADEAENVISWLLRTHCIVSKEKATELCRLTLEHGSSIDYGLIDGLTDIVCDIFGEQYHAEAEKTDFGSDTFDETDK